MDEIKENGPSLNMKDRIRQLMEEVEMNQKDFSVVTGISQSTLSSIFSGRTSATLNHALALHSNFPTVRMEWLLFGEGNMYATDGSTSESPNENTESVTDAENITSIMGTGTLPPTPLAGISPQLGTSILNQLGTLEVELQMVKNNNKQQRQISEIRIFFDDGTFQVFSPKV